jgi:hypothetical protein
MWSLAYCLAIGPDRRQFFCSRRKFLVARVQRALITGFEAA